MADRSNYEEGFFFKKNIQKIKESGLSDDSKMVLWKKLTSICFAIYWIRKDILEIIAMRTVAEILQATIDGTLKDQNSQQEYYFLEVDQLIGSLLEDWGYVHEDYVKEILPIPDNDNYYGGYYEAFTNYQESLDAFYHNLRNKDEKGLFPERPLVNYSLEIEDSTKSI
ncbi:MAG: hypothetical protein E2600_03710 [Chryseobacterium sp.]|nr:hypothetical protein [Chryseobacterium sp.]